MDDETNRYQAPAFRLTKRQKTIAGKLHNLIGPSLRSMYVDACRLVETETKLQSEALLVAHLIREIESAIRSVLLPIVDKKDGESKNSHKESIKIITSMLGIEENSNVSQSWLEISDTLHKKAHRRGLVKPELIGEEFREQHWNKFEHILLGILIQVEKTYLKLFEKVDELKDYPTPENAKFIKKWLPNNFVIQRRFFDGNSSKEWVSLLKGSTIFTQPPNVEALDDEESINPPHWPVMDYLKAMAVSQDTGVGDDIISIIQSLPETNNVRVNSDIIEVATSLPMDKSLLLEDRIKVALLSLSSSIFMRNVSGLINHWAPSGEKALEFAGWLFDVEENQDETDSFRDRFQTRFRNSDYKAAIEGSAEALMNTDAFGTLQLYCSLLGKALNIECEGKTENEYTYISRADISDNDTHKTELNALIDSIRGSSIQIMEANPKHYSNIAKLFESYKWQIFERLGIYLLSFLPQADTEKLENILVSRENFDDYKLYYEYRILAKSGFKYLVKKDQRKILSWLDDLSDLENIKIWKKEKNGRTPTEVDIEKIKAKRFRHNAYGWHEALPEKLRKKYQEIVEEYGEETPANKVSSGWRGPESPVTAETIQSWDIETLAEYLNKWKPEEGIFMPSMEGLGRELSRAVADDATEFSKAADQFKSFHPTYIRSFLDGVETGLRQNKAINWQKILNLCFFSARQTDEGLENLLESWGADETWIWTKHKACNLLKLGFSSGAKHPIPADCWELAWELIEKLLEDKNPSPEDEVSANRNDEDDYYSVAINSIRSQAIEIAIYYCLRLREENENTFLKYFPKVRAVLERHVDPAIDSSKAVKSMYGCFFPWLNLLDNDWASKNLNRIFSPSLTHDPAWRTYIIYRKPFSDCYEVLKPLYKTALLELKGTEINAEHSYFKRLYEHIVIHAFKKGHKDRLLEKLVENAPTLLLSYTMQFMGQILSDNAELGDDWKLSLKSYAEARIPHAAQEELSNFGWWFSNKHLESLWMLEKLDNVLERANKVSNQEGIIEYLTEQAKHHIDSVLRCLELILFETDIDYWAIEYKHDDVVTVLNIALSSEKELMIGKATEIINRLVAKGYNSFEALLLNKNGR